MGRFQLITIPFEEALSTLEATNSARKLYFLMGDDHFLQKFFVDKIYDKASGSNSVQKVFLIPDDISGKEIIDKLTTIDLFNTKNLFVLRNPNGLRGKVRDELIDYCQNPMAENILILVQDEYGAKNKMIQNLVSLINPISVSTPFHNKMGKWVKQFFRENGFNEIPQDIINYMVDIAGDSLNHLKNETDKIATNLNFEEDLNIKQVYEFSSWQKKLKEYDFFKLLGERNQKKTLEFGRALVSHETTLINLLYPMTEFFQELFFIKISDGTNMNSKRYTQLPRSVIKNIPNYASNYSSKEVISALKRLGQLDRKIKTSKIDDESAITEFLYATISNG
tara:strand:- start:133 stop:1143 length:1011 start_codon:yes stop_codon:yes gene_type:complete